MLRQLLEILFISEKEAIKRMEVRHACISWSLAVISRWKWRYRCLTAWIFPRWHATGKGIFAFFLPSQKMVPSRMYAPVCGSFRLRERNLKRLILIKSVGRKCLIRRLLQIKTAEFIWQNGKAPRRVREYWFWMKTAPWQAALPVTTAMSGGWDGPETERSTECLWLGMNGSLL